jgi:hypothetical protein
MAGIDFNEVENDRKCRWLLHFQVSFANNCPKWAGYLYFV